MNNNFEQKNIMIITQKNKCFDSVHSIIICVSSLYFALEYRRLGTVVCNPGDYATLEGMASGKMIRLPLCGPIDAVLSNIKPDSIDIAVEALVPKTKVFAHEINVLLKTIDSIVLPHLIIFYENNILDAEKKFGKDNYSEWPDSWRMGWVVRNAISHDNRIFYKNEKTPTVKWNRLEVSPSIQGTQIGELINFSDIILLIFDMENDLIKN